MQKSKQFFVNSASPRHFFKKNKYCMPFGSLCTKCRVSIGFRLVKGSGTIKQTNRQIDKYLSKYKKYKNFNNSQCVISLFYVDENGKTFLYNC